MKIIITGSSGLLGITAAEHFKKENEVIGIARKNAQFEADITDFKKMREIFQKYTPELLIHTAGITELKDAEKDEEKTMQVNFYATRNLANLCKEFDTTMVFISSCYVFDGTKKSDYEETDLPNAKTIYAKSKIESENYLKNNLTNYIILRVARIYGKPEYAKTGLFAKILRLLPKGEIFKLYSDDSTNPVSAEKIIEAIDKLVKNKKTGIFHVGGKTKLSSFAYGTAIAKIWKLNELQIVKSENEFDNLFRPKNMALSTKKLENEIKIALPNIIGDLKQYKTKHTY